MKKRIIDTKRVRKWKLIDGLCWFIPLAVALVRIVQLLIIPDAGLSTDEIKAILFTADDYASRRIALMGIAFLTSVLTPSIPLMVLWRFVTRRTKNSVLKAAAFNPTVDLTYYRDKLDGLSPTDISLLTDLKLEPEKDITALVLKYSTMGLVEVDDNGIGVISKSHPDLKRSDKILLSKLEAHSRFTADWQKAVIEEASASPYFKKDKSYAKNFKVGCAVHFILGIVIFIAGIVSLVTLGAKLLDPLSKALEVPEMTELMFYDMVIRDDELFKNTILIVIMALFFILCWYYPAISFIGNLAYIIIGSGNVSLVKRTEEGERLTEYIYGLKNFIRDFSMLSEAEKEQLILWDDFPIYAVLLEENDIIVDEIAHMRKQRVWKFNGSN